MVLNAVAFMFGCGLATKLISSDKGANSSIDSISRRYTSAFALSSGVGMSPLGDPVPLNGSGAPTVMLLLDSSGAEDELPSVVPAPAAAVALLRSSP